MKREPKLVWHRSPLEAPPLELVNQSLATALLEQVHSRPDASALIRRERTFSFRELAARSWELAEELKVAGTGSGPIGLLQSESADAVAAWFACSLAKRPFVLLEADHPPKRLYELAKKAGCGLILGDDSTANLRKHLGAIPFHIPAPLGKRTAHFSPAQWSGLLPDEPACIFPTSGSTGEPKLVAYASSTLQAKVQASRLLMNVEVGDRVVIAGSHSNYGFVHHALVFLLSGGAVCLVDLKSQGFEPLTHALSKEGAKHARFTPSLFRKVASIPALHPALKHLEAVRFSGEPLRSSDLELASEVLSPECIIQNVYGSTESAIFIWTTAASEPRLANATAPIGKLYPFSSYAIRALDSHDPDSGELVIRSPFQALGDYVQGQIDSSRFPLTDDGTQDRIYVTGDAVRRLPDGNLLHLGRMRRMAKVRGNRVYLTEVEEGLKRFAGVSEAGVVEVDFGGGSELYAFVTPSSLSSSMKSISEHLQEILPSYMWPKKIEPIGSMPVLPGGKIDYQELSQRVAPPILPREGAHQKEKDPFSVLCEIWDSVLGVGAHKEAGDFLALGGNSIDLIELSARIENEFNCDIPLEVFRINSSLQNLAALLHIRPTPGFEIIPYEQLHAKLLWPSKGDRSGIVLAVPSIGGWATAAPFKHAAWFPDYDLWAANYPFEVGGLTEGLRAWHVANCLAEAIHNGSIPKPDVLVGFSFGGGLAWMLARLLKPGFSPQQIVLVDAAPLHRLALERYSLFHKTIRDLGNQPAPPAIHVCRAPIKDPIVPPHKKIDWVADEDYINQEVHLPTVDHLEVIRPELLAIAREEVASFLDSEHESEQPDSAALPDLPGVAVFRAIQGDRSCIPAASAYAFNASNTLNSAQFLAMFGVFYLEKDWGSSKGIIELAVEKFPESKPLQYVHRRMLSGSKLLYRKKLPRFLPEYVRRAEWFLSTHGSTAGNQKQGLRSALLLALDIAMSQLYAKRKIRPKS
jgi:acyl-coenzyme A synthetase/AMP-(fatty) acid ligase/acyl carrier protein